MKRFASVRFDGVLGPSEREAATRPYVSAGATVTSWETTGSRSYATLAVAAGPAPPALAVLRVEPEAKRLLPSVRAALGGAGAPAGIGDVYADGDALVVEFAPDRSPLALVVAAIDAELLTAPGRRIALLVPLDDDALAAYAGFVLGEPGLTAARLIETYVEPLLQAAQP